MQIIKSNTTAIGLLNRLVRRPQRVEVTTVTPDITTIREVFKNKQVITVASNIADRCMLPI
jgi:hypothetical protein